MNIPEIYLIEPYNAYSPKGRKKHWHEVVEEQALMQRIMAEQIALQEAQSKTLPPNSPDISNPTVGNMAGGAGGAPVWDYWNPKGDVIDFSATPRSGGGPLVVQFTNLTTTPQFDTYLWLFGDGNTSTQVNPTHVYNSGSDYVGYTASLQVSGSTGPGGIEIKNGYISASKPVVTALFTTSSTINLIAPFTTSFTNSSTNTSWIPITTYKWIFSDGTTSSTTNESRIVDSGSFTASLQATGSYGIASMYTQSFFATIPTLIASFNYVTSSGPGPITASFYFTSSTMYNGHGVMTGSSRWAYGDGTYASVVSGITHAYINTGSYTASLEVTESSYNIGAYYTQSFYVPAPTITAAFTFATSSVSASINTSASFVNTSTYVTSSGIEFGDETVLTYLWTYDSASLISTAAIPLTVTYNTPGNFTASLQITESKYGIASFVSHGWRLA